jgi:N-acetylmuramoyl-L-alanine amidase
MKKTRKLLVLFLAIAMTVSMLAFPASAEGSIAYGAATVTASTLNIRSGPSTSYSIAGTVSYGSKVVVLEKTSSSWYRINYKGTKGYVSTAYLKDVVKAENFDATGSVTGSDCRMRSQPNTSSSILGTYSYGTKMSVVGINNGWYKVQYSGKTGYMRSDLMEIVSGSTTTTTTTQPEQPTQPEEPAKENLKSVDADYGIVNGSGCRMRSEPNTNCTILGVYNRGTKMSVLGMVNNWYKVQYNGKTGYMRSDLMILDDGDSSSSDSSSSNSGSSGSSDSSSDIRDRIVNFALRYEGYAYVWGGESLAEGGFDCSGFVYYVYKTNFGYNMARTASQQYAKNGTWVSRSNIRKGDVIFFSDDGYGVTHVGIYIGGGRFIHAANSRKGVIISELSGYYDSVYWGAKNIVGD